LYYFGTTTEQTNYSGAFTASRPNCAATYKLEEIVDGTPQAFNSNLFAFDTSTGAVTISGTDSTYDRTTVTMRVTLTATASTQE
jgi:hypothetical protein